MNPIIEQHFNAVEARLLQSPVFVTYQIAGREIILTDGKLLKSLRKHWDRILCRITTFVDSRLLHLDRPEIQTQPLFPVGRPGARC